VRNEQRQGVRRRAEFAAACWCALCAVGMLAAGCSSPGGLGDGPTIAEYRELEPELRRRAIAKLREANRLIDRGDYEAAQENLVESIGVYDQVGAAWNNLGVALMKQDKYPEANSAFARAISLDPTDYRPHFNRGLLYFRRGFLREARPLFERAALTDSSQLGPLWYAIRIDSMLGRETEQTLEFVERAMMLENDDRYLQKLQIERLRIEQILEEREESLGVRIEESEISTIAPDLPPEAVERLVPQGGTGGEDR